MFLVVNWVQQGYDNGTVLENQQKWPKFHLRLNKQD